MMQPPNPQTQASILLPLLLHLFIALANSPPKLLNQNATTSPWLKRITNRDPDPNPTPRPNPRAPGCWNRPWICNQGEYPPRLKRLCCRNRCVDVSSDVNNCGLCGIRCPFTWQCCRGLCINTNSNPFHCGSCDHRCPFLSYCFYGMCGYAQPLPPYPFPLPPLPPFPFPPKPQPPHGPFPKPPHGPWPKPPHGPWPKPPHGPKHGGQPPPSG